MLSVITGLPGNGKTLYTLDLVDKFVKSQHADALKVDPEAQPRTVYQAGIPELTWDWQKLESAERWFELPTGAIIVIDESQRHFPVMSHSAKRPDHYMRFDMHRHQGHDIFLITQDSQLIDTQVRAMCGRHVHIVRPFGMEYANVYEWPAVTNTRGKDCSKDTQALKSKWMYRKELYDVYKSAEAHTHKKELPWKKLGGIAAAIVLPVVIIVFALGRIGSGMGDEPVAEGAAVALPDGTMPRALAANTINQDIFHDLEAWTPRVQDVPMSARVYNDSLRIRDVPRVSGCMLIDFGSDSECTCTDQQGNDIDVSISFCRTFVRSGMFDPTVATNGATTFRR